MLSLSSSFKFLSGTLTSDKRKVLKVRRIFGNQPTSEEHDAVLWDGSGELPKAAAYLVKDEFVNGLPLLTDVDRPVIGLPTNLGYLDDGDILALSGASGRLRVLYRKKSFSNTFLVTERCDNFCLMCSQPPKDINDDWIIDEILTAIPLIDRETREIGFSGGEPTLLGSRFLSVLRASKDLLPSTAIHVLSNGRKFSDESYANEWANVAHSDLMVGIPIYGDNSADHDFVVQAQGAFEETIKGILNLKKKRQRVEIRVVIHSATHRNLERIAEFIARNLTFVDHVALMGLEIMGFARANLEMLWVDPYDYQRELIRAVDVLRSQNITTSIYNHQLCVLDRELWPFSVKSISDWKNEFLDECRECRIKPECGGLFSSGKQFKRSAHLRAL